MKGDQSVRLFKTQRQTEVWVEIRATAQRRRFRYLCHQHYATRCRWRDKWTEIARSEAASHAVTIPFKTSQLLMFVLKPSVCLTNRREWKSLQLRAKIIRRGQKSRILKSIQPGPLSDFLFCYSRTSMPT